jgi:hypothetical protein
MRFALDVTFLDAGGDPIATHHQVPAGRIVREPAATAVLEVPA